MSDQERAMAWWKSLRRAERERKILAAWEMACRPLIEPQKKARRPNPKLDLDEVEELSYRAKRGIQTASEYARFSRLRDACGEMTAFKAAVLRGQARAIAELPLQPPFEVILARLHES